MRRRPKDVPCRMRSRIDIESPVDGARDAHGQKVVTWQAVHSQVAAHFKQLSGSEAISARQLDAKATHKVTIRYADSITTRCRLKLGERIFHIGRINNLEERNTWLELTVSEDVE